MPGRYFGIIIGCGVIFLFLIGPLVIDSSHAPLLSHVDAQTESRPLGIVIPLYAHPGSTWTSIIQAKQSYPHVPFLVVINPKSGPGSSLEPSYLTGVQEMQAAGITVLGYVDTAYATDSIQSVEANVNLYNSWYHVNGVMFDDMQNTVGTEGYYATLNNFVHSIGLALTMGNPGATVPTSDVGVLNILDIYENPGLPTLSGLSFNGIPTSDFSLIAYDVSSMDNYFLYQAIGYVSYIYLTDALGSNPYDVLPSYFTSEVAELSALDSSSSGSLGDTISTTSPLRVNSVNSLGNSITGYYTEFFYSTGTLLGTSYTPTTHSLRNGVGYRIEAYSFGPCTFSYWEGGPIGGSTADPSPVVTISSPTTITAVYTGSGCGPQTTTSSSSSPVSEGTITVESALINGGGGGSFGGMYATIVSSGGIIVDEGYTPLVYSGSIGAHYKVMVDNYGSCSFSNWADGSKVNPRTVSATINVQFFTAVYSCSATSTIQVTALNSAGRVISGYYIALMHNGAEVNSCYSSCSFSVSNGDIYQVIAESYGLQSFNYWANDDSSGAETILVPATASTISLTAIYSP
jgi:hypothetical protein